MLSGVTPGVERFTERFGAANVPVTVTAELLLIPEKALTRYPFPLTFPVASSTITTSIDIVKPELAKDPAHLPVGLPLGPDVSEEPHAATEAKAIAATMKRHDFAAGNLEPFN